MLKGVNRQIIEINDTGNKYFEKALLFVAAGRSRISESELSRHAQEYMLTLSPGDQEPPSLRERCEKKKRKKIYMCVAAALLICAAAVIVFNIL